MTKEEALKAIKQLRDKINDDPDPAGTGWINDVCENLDRAADVIEFPKAQETSQEEPAAE